MGNIVDHLADQFRSSELVRIAEAVGLAPSSRWSSRRLIGAINSHVDRVGVPKLKKGNDDNDLLEEYLYVAEFTDEKGNPLQKGDKKKSLAETLKEMNREKVPDCFGYADDGAPECKRCPLYDFCAEDRVANLPSCFGELHDFNSPECKCCLEAPFCKGETSKEAKPSRRKATT